MTGRQNERQQVSKGPPHTTWCWGPGQGRTRVDSGYMRGWGSPRVSRKVLGPFGQDLCGPLQVLQAGASHAISLNLLLLTGGARVCTGWGRTIRTRRVSPEDLPTAYSSLEGRSDPFQRPPGSQDLPRDHPCPTSRPCSPPS